MTLAAVGCREAVRTDEVGDFQNKTVRLIVGYPPGGGNDLHGRTLARHLGRHLPGNPDIIVENMPGAASLVATRFLLDAAPRDGLTFGLIELNGLVGDAPGGIEEAALRSLVPLGAAAPLTPVCVFNRSSGVDSLQAWTRASTPLRLGTTGRAGLSYRVPRILQEALHLPIRIVSGYSGSSELRLALETGEIDGTCLSADAVAMFLSGGREMTAVLRAGLAGVPWADQLPTAEDLATSDEARALIEVGIVAPNAFGRLYVVPPGVPAERVALLRNAVMQTLADPALLAAAAAANIHVAPLSAQEVGRSLDRLAQSPSTLTALRAILASP